MIPASQRVQVSFTLPITIEEKDGWFIATCSVFDVVTQGETRERAKTNVEDALGFFLQSCIKRGTISRFFRSLAWSRIAARHPTSRRMRTRCKYTSRCRS